MSTNNDSGQSLSRRDLVAGLGLAAGTAAVSATASAAATGGGASARDLALDTWMAKDQVAELRRRYARATDLIGLVTDAGIAEGRAIYHRVFTADAKLGAAGQPTVTGPDAWVDIVINALKVYKDTQHLIGTQLVDIVSLPDADGKGGEATMKSYLQAWHARADGLLWLFIGTYHDKARYTPGVGWQIYEMILEQVSTDTRQLGR